MNKEIELKAWVDDPEVIKKWLTLQYGEAEEINKDDIYYLYKCADTEETVQPVRLRVDNGKNVVTLKRKSQSEGIEINDELEFEVDKGENFLRFMQMTGAEAWVNKKKKGWKFWAQETGPAALIELCEVSSLGWFIEIEVVIDSPDKSQIKDAQRKIRNILESTGISENKIEQRYYSDMLLGKKRPARLNESDGKGG